MGMMTDWGLIKDRLQNADKTFRFMEEKRGTELDCAKVGSVIVLESVTSGGVSCRLRAIFLFEGVVWVPVRGSSALRLLDLSQEANWGLN